VRRTGSDPPGSPSAAERWFTHGLTVVAASSLLALLGVVLLTLL